MANITLKYGTKAALTITLASLADAAARGALKVDNSADENIDVHLGGKITTGTTPTVDTVINIYVCGSDDDALYDDQHGGTDAAHTLGGNARLLHSIVVTASSDVAYEFGGLSVGKAFGGVLPKYWAIVVENQTGAALNSTGSNHEVNQTSVNYQQV